MRVYDTAPPGNAICKRNMEEMKVKSGNRVSIGTFFKPLVIYFLETVNVMTELDERYTKN